MTFKSQGFRGQVQKRVTFSTNDPKHSALTFSVRGKVKAVLFSEPERINWGLVKKGAELHAEIAIVNNSAKSIRLQQPEITTDGIAAELSTLIIASGEQAHVQVSAAFPGDKNRLAGYIIINSDFPLRPQLRIPVSARLSQR